MIRKTIKLILIVLCMVTIFLFSQEKAEESSEKSDGLIIKITEFVKGRPLTEKEKDEYLEKFVTPVRKSAHFTIYFLLGLFIISYIKEYKVITNKEVLITILVVFLYACSDEIHQIFVPGRSGEIRDILIDTLGGSLSSSLYFLIYKIRSKKHE